MALLSVFVVGLGQLVLGQTGKGMFLFFGTISLVVFTCGYGLLLVPLVWIFAGVDAYMVAAKLRRGIAVSPWEFF